jgi:hypothetical protein
LPVQKTLTDIIIDQVKINNDIGKRFQATDKLLENMYAKMDSFTLAIQNQMSFNKMLETQIQSISAALPCPIKGIPSRDPIRETMKNITTLFEGQAPESFEEPLGTNERISKVNRQQILVSMSEVSSDAILNRHRNQLDGSKVPSIQCIIGPLKVHYALCDWGASVNIMPKIVYDYLDEDRLVPVSWT